MSQPNLILVPSTRGTHETRESQPRPIETLYFKAVADRGKDWYKTTHSATKMGAVKAAVGKIMKKIYYKAHVRMEDGSQITITRVGRKIEIVGNITVEDLLLH